MLGLIFKDLLCLKKSSIKLIIILGLYIVIFSPADNIIFLCTMIIVISTTLILNTFAYDELSKWDYYALSLPVTKKQIVFTKYLLSAVFNVLGFSIALLLYLIKRQFSVETVLSVYALSASGLVLASVLLPLLYKLGAQKARIWMILIFLLPTAGVAVMAKLGFNPTTSAPSEGIIEMIIWASLPAALLLYTGSYFLSCYFLENKEI